MPSQGSTHLHPAFHQAEVFSSLAEHELRDVVSHFKQRSFTQDECLFLEGQPAETYFFLAEGRVKIVQTSAEGFEVILHVLGPGELLGALPTLGEGLYPASAYAMTPVLAFSIVPSHFETILRSYPSVTMHLLRFATGIIQTTHRKLRELATERVEQRVARTLTQLAAQIGRRLETGILLDTPLSRQDLAEMTGTTLYTVSRILRRWEREHIVEAGRKRVLILDPHRLTSIAEDLPQNQGKT